MIPRRHKSQHEIAHRAAWSATGCLLVMLCPLLCLCYHPRYWITIWRDAFGTWWDARRFGWIAYDTEDDSNG